MIVVFFGLNAPVNDAVSKWTPATVPLDWTGYRVRWETGHAVAPLLSVVSLAALIRAFLQERQFGHEPIRCSFTSQSAARIALPRVNQPTP